MMAKNVMISIDNLVVRFKSSDKGKEDLMVLDGISFNARAAERIAIVGPSGCGKTTLLRVLAGLVEPTEGKIKFQNYNELTHSQIGFVPQRPALIPWKTARENIQIPLKAINIAKDAANERSSELLDFFGLDGFGDYFPHQLSGGMQSRVSIARALAVNPSILLLDECFGNLDELTREKLNVELSPIWAKLKTTVILVTHSVREAVFLADRILVLGRIPAKIEGEVTIDSQQPRKAMYFESDDFRRNEILVRRLLKT